VIRHLLKLVWNRKRANALVIVEIFFSFLVVFALAAVAITLGSSYRKPLGFDWTDVWTISIDVGQQTDDEFTAEQVETFSQVLREARSLDRVEAAAGILSAPYTFSSSTTTMRPRGASDGSPSFDVEVNEVTDGALDALDLEIVSGRWFDASDDGVAWQPVVVDRDLARAFFGRVDVAGEWLDDAPRPAAGTAPARARRRVVGVVSEFRQHGELSLGGNYLFLRRRVGDPATRPPRNLVLEMAPGTPRGYEEELLDRLAAVAPSWSFVARPMAESRASSFRLRLVPLSVGGIVGAFLMTMVALGLVGVLWQNVVRRTRELGLRRATGATRRRIHRQISMELLLVTTLGLALGALLVIQLPILDLVPALSAGVFAAAVATAAGLLLALALSASLYPAWLAARVQPADALRWE
jgi:putative ABC transport system permease protein